ncbi:hypothetical protein D3C84_538630 [compost metagenome]
MADPDQGAQLLAVKRAVLSAEITTAQGMFNAQAANPREFAHLATGYTVGGDPSTWDWGPAILATTAAHSIIDGAGQTYPTTNIVITQKVSMRNIAFSPAPSVVGQTLVKFTADNCFIEATVDCGSKGITAIEVTGKNCLGTATGHDLVGQPQAAGGTQSILKLSGEDCRFHVDGWDITHGTSDNDSIPRLVTTDLTNPLAKNNFITARGENVNAGWVTSQPGARCGDLWLNGVQDNGIYHLGGQASAGTVVIHNCDDEPVVAKGDFHIDSLGLIGCDGFCSLSNANMSVGHLWFGYVPGKATQAFITRADNVMSTLTIGSISGEIELVRDPTLGGIFQFIGGTLDRLTVGPITLKVHYTVGSTKILANMGFVNGVDIGKLAIELIDDTGTLTFADKFDFRLPNNITKPSYLGDVLNVSTTGEIRVANVAQNLLQFSPGSELSTTFGPYILPEQTALPTPRVFYAQAVPTTGTFLRGDILIIKLPSIGLVTKYRCITAGTPGVWRAVEWAVQRGATGSRPTLTASDVGVQFFDTTLAAAGKPIWWTGQAWVDALAAAV